MTLNVFHLRIPNEHEQNGERNDDGRADGCLSRHLVFAEIIMIRSVNVIVQLIEFNHLYYVVTKAIQVYLAVVGVSSADGRFILMYPFNVSC